MSSFLLVLPSVEHIIPNANPTGTCKLWRVEKLEVAPSPTQLEEMPEGLREDERNMKRPTKSFMFFEGCSPAMGASVVLRGGASFTLDVLRRILENLVKKAYLLTLQQKLFADLSARAVPTDEAMVLDMLDKESIPLWQVRTKGVLQATFPEKIRYRFWEDAMDQPLGLFLLKRGAGLKRQPEQVQGGTASAGQDAGKEREKGSIDAQGISANGSTDEGAPGVASQEMVNLDETMDYFSIFYIHGERRLKVIFENLNVTKDPGLVAIREQLLSLRRKIVAMRVTDSSVNRRGGSMGSGSAQISANFLLCWSACKACGRRTKVKPLSRDAAYISYGKFIQMKLYDTFTRVQLPGCTHLLFQDCITYFEYFGVVGSFEYEPNKVYKFTLGGGASSLHFHESWLSQYVPFRALKLEVALAHISKTFARRISKFSSHLNKASSKEGSSPVMGTLNASIVQRCEALAEAINDEVQTLKKPLANEELSLSAICLLQKRLLQSIARWNNRFEDMQDRISVPKPTPAFANLVLLPPQWTKMVESDTASSSKTESIESGQSEADTGENKLRRHESDGSTKHLMPQVDVSAAFSEGHPLMLHDEDPCPCLVFTNEPTSMIAHCLGSKAYQSAVATKIANQNLTCEKLVDVLAIEGSKGQDEVKLTFHDESPNVTFEIKVFHALKFEALRNPEGGLESIPEGDTLRFILSLSRCSAWGASGGKTKAKFFRSQDNTLLAKTISIEELELFHASATKYFAHMHASYTGNIPSAIMKILGIYTLSVTNGFSADQAVEDNPSVSNGTLSRGDSTGEPKEGVQE